MTHDETNIQAARLALIAHLHRCVEEDQTWDNGPTLLVGRYPYPHPGPGRQDGWVGQSVYPATPETYYPLSTVLAVLGHDSLMTLEEDWHCALGQTGPLPLYLHRTENGHYTALVPETVILDHLIWLSDDPMVLAYQEALEDARV